MTDENDRRIDYVEMPAPEYEATKSFYEAAFGWSFTDYGPDYTSFADGRLSGGLYRGGAAVRGGLLVVLYAVDLEDVERAAVANGGTIVRATFSFPGGRRFHFTDPSGNELAVWSDRDPR